MRIWIPDIGDKIVLTADWHFTLINEGRNSAIWKALDLENHPSVRAHEAKRNAIYDEAMKHDKDHRSKRVNMTWGGFRMEWDSDENERKSEQLWDQYKSVEYPFAPVVIPKDTTLTIDRVYIRKGASEFSSLTFFVGTSPMKELMPANKGGRWTGGQRRFFAHLPEVNKIECEIIS